MSGNRLRGGNGRRASRGFFVGMMFAATLLSGALFLALPASTQTQRGADDAPATEFFDGQEVGARRVIVKFSEAKNGGALAQIERTLDAVESVEVGKTGARLIRSRSKDTKTLVRELSARADVVYAEPDYFVRGGSVPNDAQYGQQWGLQNSGQTILGTPGTSGADIDAPPAWDITTGGRAHVVAIADSGIDYNHPDLAANVWSAPAPFTVQIGGQSIPCGAGTHGFNAINNSCNPLDDHNHGTHVAGIIGAVGNNGAGVSGVNWQTSMMAVKWLNSQNSGFISDAIDAIEFAIQVRQAFAATGGADVRVINNSWFAGSFSNALLEEVRRARDNGMLFVAIAGNGTSNNFIPKDVDASPVYPGSFGESHILNVAATNNQDGLAFFSNYGRTSVHVGAPGERVYSTIRTGNGSYTYFNGTSMAAPHVSGAAALLLSRCALTTEGLKGVLITSVDPVVALDGKTTSGGRLSVGSAVDACTSNPAIVDDARFFVRQHYVDFFNREPDAAGMAFWTNQITECGADAGCREARRVNVSAAFFLSIEFQQTGYLVYRMHQAAFNTGERLRLPELLPDTQRIGRGVVVNAPGWEQQLEQNKQAYADEFVARAQFQTRYPSSLTAGEYVDALNANASGSLSPSEREGLVAGLNNATETRATVLRKVAEDSDFASREFNRAFVLMQYIGYLRRNPDAPPNTDFSGYEFWLAKLNEFGGNFVDAEMVESFIVAGEYRQRFSQP